MIDTTVRLLKDIYERAMEAGRKEGWREEETLRNLVIHGLNTLEISGETDGKENPEDEIHRLTRELLDARCANAALKFKVHTLARDNRTLEWKVTGLSAENRNYQVLVETLKREIRDLKDQGDKA